MPINARNLLRHELIGLKVEVGRSRNRQLIGMRGVVVDETRNTLVVESRGRRRRLIKDVSAFRFELPDGTVVDVDGRRLVARPEDRIKARLRRW